MVSICLFAHADLDVIIRIAESRADLVPSMGNSNGGSAVERRVFFLDLDRQQLTSPPSEKSRFALCESSQSSGEARWRGEGERLAEAVETR